MTMGWSGKSHLLRFLAGIVSLFSCIAAAGMVKTARVDGYLLLENEWSCLMLRETDFTLHQMSNLQTGCEYVAEPGAGLYRLVLHTPGEAPNVWYELPPGVCFQANDFPQRSAEPFGDGESGGWELTFGGVDCTDGNIQVTIRISLTADSPLFQWDIGIDNHTDQAIQHLEFPCLSGLGCTGTEACESLAVPIYSGQKRTNIRHEAAAAPGLTEYPGSGMSIQLLTYEDGNGNALYFASHDALNFRKTFVAVPNESHKSFNIRTIHYPASPCRQASWQLPYPMIVGPFSGDWYDACKMYRSWATAQPHWRTSLAERKDVPTWLAETPVWFQGNEWTDTEEALLAFADRIVAARKGLGFPIAFHWYLWQHHVTHDFAYPDYLPARPGFAEAVRKVQDAGCRVIPYLNIHLCETQLPVWGERGLSQAAKRNCRNELYRCYGVCDDRSRKDDATAPVDVFRGEVKGRDMVPMCPGEPMWQEVILEQARGVLKDYNPDALYWDETFCYAGLCYADNHRHSWIGGSAHADGIAEIHRRTSGLRPDDFMTVGENLGECYINVCPALLNGHSDGRGDSLPIFQTVFADRVAEIGLFVKPGELRDRETFVSKLAFCLLRGRILGWFNSDQGLLDIVQPEFSWQLEMLRQYCDIRLTGLPWLYAGEMLRKPDMSNMPMVIRTWNPWGTNRDVEFAFPAVEAACYRSADGRLGIILANLTSEDQMASFPWNFKDWGHALGARVLRSEYRDGTWSSPEELTLADAMAVELKPFQVVIVAFNAKSPL